ncbi:sugar ABC transporter ATP-binding protein [Populibacterium corticicola]|uniref:Sugar ABC transporter ATP-binding protein n=1 Tax=Populibacterium corticicola TaxID=1812826 RepID=A0ABW5XH11_9MICO
MDQEPLLHIEGLQKSFSGTTALSDACLTVYPGEVHALMGQNGAGKSTLIKTLTGIYTGDGGKIEFCGQPINFRSPYEAQRGGISTIYQEINLVGLRSVAENVFLGQEPTRFSALNRSRMDKEAKTLLARVGIDVDPRLPLARLSTAAQQMVAIARALSFRSKLVIMDEPTSSLHDREVDTLFEVIDNLRQDGVSVIFTSHKLDELYRICDKVTILRDGRTVRTSPMADISRIELVATMLGKDPRQIEASGQTAFERPKAPKPGVEPLLDVRRVSSGGLCRDAALSLHAGEVVGVAGLLGSGRSELAAAVYGMSAIDSGDMELSGTPYKPRSARDALKKRISLTPEDRKVSGLVGPMSISENITLSILDRISTFGVIRKNREEKIVAEMIDSLGVKSSGPQQPVNELSGGNQQKVLLARSLVLEPKILILDEPTRGVDVGAKAEIQRMISSMVANNRDRGVIMISSEMEEIIEGSNRIMIMRDGETVAFLDASTVTNGQLMLYMASGDTGADVSKTGDIR